MDVTSLPSDWPFREAGRRVLQGAHRWWVCDIGAKDAPSVLLLHGLGASGHSFRNLIPVLAPHYRLIIPDLPGHGGTKTANRTRIALGPIAQDLSQLCHVFGVEPIAVVGHSAGAAIALEMATRTSDLKVVGINAALEHFDGAASLLFPVLAQGLAALPFAGQLFSKLWGSQRKVRQLLEGTGSTLDDAGVAQYVHLVQSSAHIKGALDMMAQWRLDPLLARLETIDAKVLLIAGSGDLVVPAQISRSAARRLPNAQVIEVTGGHLVHEETSSDIGTVILQWLQTETVSPPAR